MARARRCSEWQREEEDTQSVANSAAGITTSANPQKMSQPQSKTFTSELQQKYHQTI